jgi:hypothetical protein
MRSIYKAIFLLVDHASAPFIYGRMIECAKTWDGTLRERRDSLLNLFEPYGPADYPR